MMLRRESESSPWMSGFSSPSTTDYTSLPRCAVLSFHREGDTVHWKPWLQSPTPSPPLAMAKVPSDADRYKAPKSSRDTNDGVIDLTAVLALAVQHGMTAPPPPPPIPRRLFGWQKARRHTEPDSAPTESSGRSPTVKECAWIGPTRLSLDTPPSPRTPETPVSYREFVPPATPIDLPFVPTSTHRLDTRGIALMPTRAQSSMSDSMVLMRRKEGSRLERGRKSRGKRIYRKLRKLWTPPPPDKSRRTWPSLRMRTSPDIHSENSDDAAHSAPADVYMQFMTQ